MRNTFNGAQKVLFCATFNKKIIQKRYPVPTFCLYFDAQRGSMAQPVVLQLSEATGIDNQWANGQMAVKSILLFDGSGRLSQ